MKNEKILSTKANLGAFTQKKIIYYEDLIDHLKNLRESNMKNIEIVDEDEYNKDF